MRIATAITALSLATGASATGQHQAVLEVAKRAIEGFDAKDSSSVQGATWSDGYLIQQGRGSLLKRRWGQVPFSGLGVLVQHSFNQPKTAINGDRASLFVGYRYRINYADRVAQGIDVPVECGVGTYQFDLRRRKGEWRVLTLTDSMQRQSRRCTA